MKMLCDRLKETREEKGWSQTELAAHAKISQSFIGALETGRQKTSKWLPEIARVLGVNPFWLKTGKGAKEADPLQQTGLYITDPQLIAAVKVMEALPDYARSAAIKDIAAVAELIQQARAANNGTDG